MIIEVLISIGFTVFLQEKLSFLEVVYYIGCVCVCVVCVCVCVQVSVSLGEFMAEREIIGWWRRTMGLIRIIKVCVCVCVCVCLHNFFFFPIN